MTIEKVDEELRYQFLRGTFYLPQDRRGRKVLSKLNRWLPGVPPAVPDGGEQIAEALDPKSVIPETKGEEAKIIIEIDHGSYQIDTVKVNQNADVTESKFLTEEEFDLECGARYKLKPDIQGGHRSIYRTLTILGIGLLVWLTRG